MPHINEGYRPETQMCFFSCLSCCICPPSNKTLSIWAAFSCIIMHIWGSSRFMNKHGDNIDWLILILLVAQFIFGLFHFYSVWWFHIVSNLSEVDIRDWWKRFIWTMVLQNASFQSFAIMCLGTVIQKIHL
eukprot:UN30252